MLLSDMKIKHHCRGRTEKKASFQGEISRQRESQKNQNKWAEHGTDPQDQNIMEKTWKTHWEMCNPLPLMSKGEEKQATKERDF